MVKETHGEMLQVVEELLAQLQQNGLPEARFSQPGQDLSASARYASFP
jgi:hypothetical protein